MTLEYALLLTHEEKVNLLTAFGRAMILLRKPNNEGLRQENDVEGAVKELAEVSRRIKSNPKQISNLFELFFGELNVFQRKELSTLLRKYDPKMHESRNEEIDNGCERVTRHDKLAFAIVRMESVGLTVPLSLRMLLQAYYSSPFFVRSAKVARIPITRFHGEHVIGRM